MVAEGYPIKLVRDRVADVDTSEGIRFRPVRERDDLVRLLRAKLLEEAGEFLLDPSAEELADLLEVARALAYHDLRVPFSTVEHLRERKKRQRGGFHRGTIMETVEP